MDQKLLLSSMFPEQVQDPKHQIQQKPLLRHENIASGRCYEHLFLVVPEILEILEQFKNRIPSSEITCSHVWVMCTAMAWCLMKLWASNWTHTDILPETMILSSMETGRAYQKHEGAMSIFTARKENKLLIPTPLVQCMHTEQNGAFDWQFSNIQFNYLNPLFTVMPLLKVRYFNTAWYCSKHDSKFSENLSRSTAIPAAQCLSGGGIIVDFYPLHMDTCF